MNRPNFDGIYGAAANPLRLVYLMGTLWRLAEDLGGRAIDILEIGSWCGASALTWGEALKLHNRSRGRITCIDAWEPFADLAANPDEVNRDMDQTLAAGQPFEVFRHNIGFLPEGVGIDIRRGWSSDILAQLPRAAFDLVYIDGDHCYDGVGADIANCIPLVRDGGIICGDDLELQAGECDVAPARQDAKLDKFYDRERGIHYHPGVALAVDEAFGPVSAWHGFWATRRAQDGWRDVSLDGMPFNIPSHLPAPSLIGLKALLMEKDVL